MLISGCASPQPWTWKTQVMPTTRNLQVPAGEDLLGKGLKLGTGGYRVLNCLSAIERTTSAGQTSVTFDAIEPRDVQDPRLSRMLDRIFDPERGVDPVALQLSIAIDAVRNDLDERASQLRQDVLSDVDASRADGLFEACGTRLITAVRRRAQLDLLFVVYPRTSAERNEVGLLLERHLQGSAHNTMRSRVLDELTKYPFRTMLQTDSDAIMTPLDFPLGRWKGRSLGDLLPKVSRLLLQAKSGPVLSYVARPWRMTPLGANTIQSQSEDPTIGERREQLFDDHRFAAVLMDSARRRLGQARFARKEVRWFLRADQCQKLLERQLGDERLSACLDDERALQTRACRLGLRALDQTLLGPACAPLPVAARSSDDPLLLETTRSPLIAAATPPQAGRAQAHPASIPFGAGVDAAGRMRSETCIADKLSDHLDGNRTTAETEIMMENNLVDRRTWWQRFTGHPEPPIERVELTVRQLSRNLLPSFELKEAAKQLAQRNLRAFYARCGTHYVRGGIDRRGLIIDVRQKEARLTISTHPVGLSRSAASSPILKDARLERILSNQAALKQLFERADRALIEQLHLEPWADYLLENNVIKAADLDPTGGG